MSGINITGTSTDTGPGVRLKINITCEDLRPGYIREHKDFIKDLLNTELTKYNVNKVSIFIDAKDELTLWNSRLDEIIESLGQLSINDIWIYTELNFTDIMEGHCYWFTRSGPTYVCGKDCPEYYMFNDNKPVYRKSFNQRIWQGKALQPGEYANFRYKDITAIIDPNYTEYLLRY